MVKRCRGVHTVQYSTTVQCSQVKLQPSVVRQEDLWSALPLPLNHLAGDSASQQVFCRYRMKNACLYVTPSLRPSEAQYSWDVCKFKAMRIRQNVPHFCLAFFCNFFFCSFDAWKTKVTVRFVRILQRRLSRAFCSVHFSSLSKITHTAVKANVTVPSGVIRISQLSFVPGAYVLSVRMKVQKI